MNGNVYYLKRNLSGRTLVTWTNIDHHIIFHPLEETNVGQTDRLQPQRHCIEKYNFQPKILSKSEDLGESLEMKKPFLPPPPRLAINLSH
jgi:hypothetical protein